MPKIKNTYCKGSIHTTNKNGDYKVLKYIDSKHIKIKFIDTGYVCIVTFSQCNRGIIKDLYKPNVSGVGYLGDGVYNKKECKREYRLWMEMLARCYSYHKYNRLAYTDVTVDTRWHSFQKFCKDIHKIPNWGNLEFELDKDLLSNKNTMYSMKTCCFIPAEINRALIRKNFRSKGIKLVNGRFMARLGSDGLYLGCFSSAEEAHKAYIKAKIKRIRKLADKYKDSLDAKVYEALYNFRPKKLL